MPARLTGILRENVAALVVRGDGRCLIGECSDKPGWWSFPQGGVEPGETWREALRRELAEETGLRATQYEVGDLRSGYVYVYPGGHLKKGIYRGQRQAYFLCLLTRGEPRPGDRRRPEFLRLRWVAPADFDLSLVPPFKREVTAQVLRDFFGVAPRQHTSPDETSADTANDIML